MPHCISSRIIIGIIALSSVLAAGIPFSGRAETTADPGSKKITWTSFQQLGVEGRGWTNTKSFYDRLPAKAENVVRPPVWDLSHSPAGMCVRFVTDATTIRARWTLDNAWLYLPNETAIANSGLDLYVKINGVWRWLAVGIPQAQSNDVALAENLLPGKREYLLYLPLFNGIKSAELGIPTNAVIEKAPAWGPGVRKPVVFYGTSTTHGLSASRPGMVHTAMLQRKFNWPVINLGFSGNGRMEPEMTGLLAELDPAVYVIDCLPNMDAGEIKERTGPLVKKLRAAHPLTPIVLVEDRTLQGAFLTQGQMEWYHLKDRAELKAAFDRLQKDGVKELYYISGEHLLGDDGEGSTDGSHPNDLGFMRQAAIFAETLKPLLKAETEK